MHGFASAHDYYHRSSAIRYLAHVRRPTLLLSAYDDPFLPPDVLDDVVLMARQNSFLLPEFWNRGGHVGFVDGQIPFRARYFAEERALDYLARQVAFNVRMSSGA
jgi:predicted alpha/beta-fold hydrolase